MLSTETYRRPLSMHDILPKVYSFLAFISLKKGTIIIGILSVIYCILHIILLSNREYHDSENASIIKSIWKTLIICSDVALGVLGAVLVFAVVKSQMNLARLWLLAALQNGILLLIFEFFACPLHYKDPISKLAFSEWPFTLIYCIIPFVMLYFMYVVNSYIVSLPILPSRPRSRTTSESIPLMEWR